MIFGIAGLIVLIIYHNRIEHLSEDLLDMFFLFGGILMSVWLSVFISILLSNNISGTVKMIVGLIPVIVSLMWYIIVHIKYPPDKKQKK